MHYMECEFFCCCEGNGAACQKMPKFVNQLNFIANNIVIIFKFHLFYFSHFLLYPKLKPQQPRTPNRPTSTRHPHTTPHTTSTTRQSIRPVSLTTHNPIITNNNNTLTLKSTARVWTRPRPLTAHIRAHRVASNHDPLFFNNTKTNNNNNNKPTHHTRTSTRQARNTVNTRRRTTAKRRQRTVELILLIIQIIIIMAMAAWSERMAPCRRQTTRHRRITRQRAVVVALRITILSLAVRRIVVMWRIVTRNELNFIEVHQLIIFKKRTWKKSKDLFL